MKILSAAQTRALDQATIREQNIISVELMERAARAFTGWFAGHFSSHSVTEVLVLCGPGNNGGDGLAVARRLQQAGYAVRVALHSGDVTQDTGGPPWLIAAGGVTSLADIRALRKLGLDGAIVGRALYSGDMDLAAALRVAQEEEESDA